MLVLLAIVVGIGTSAISLGNRSLVSIDKIQGKELSALSSSYTAALRARTVASQATRLYEIGSIDQAQDTLRRVEDYVNQSHREMVRFLAYGTVTKRDAELAVSTLPIGVADDDSIRPLFLHSGIVRRRAHQAYRLPNGVYDGAFSRFCLPAHATGAGYYRDGASG